MNGFVIQPHIIMLMMIMDNNSKRTNRLAFFSSSFFLLLVRNNIFQHLIANGIDLCVQVYLMMTENFSFFFSSFTCNIIQNKIIWVRRSVVGNEI